MFDHSVKVPQLYKVAAKIAKEVQLGKGSIKQLVYERVHLNTKALYALVVNTFKKSDELELLLKKSKLLIKEPRFDPWLAKILITELLWGKKRLQSQCKPIQTILAYEQMLKAHISDEINTETTDQYDSVDKPRYVRINTLKISINEAVEAFMDEGWVLKRFFDKDYQSFLRAVSELGPEEFMVDMHIADLLIFPPKTQFYRHKAYKDGLIILQDKASCLPVHILNPEPGSTVLDMCAAPGMKTTHAAAKMNNTGTIYAVELKPKRFEVLKKMVESSGATCVKPINRDVTTLRDNDVPKVDYIIVDPSCSGSGLTDRVEVGQQDMDQDRQRLVKLAGFQITMLRHALTSFPHAKKVVYSTCSLFAEENEDVVRQVMEGNSNYKLVSAGDFVGNQWMNYGSSDFGEIGPKCLYSHPNIDMTSGFFVAVFERLGEGEKNELFSRNIRLLSKKQERNQKREARKKEMEELEQKRVESSFDISAREMVEEFREVSKKRKRIKLKKNEEILETEEKMEELQNDEPIKKKKKIKKEKEADIKDEQGVSKKKKKIKDEEVEAETKKIKVEKDEENLDEAENKVSKKKKKIKKEKEPEIVDPQENQLPKKKKIKEESVDKIVDEFIKNMNSEHVETDVPKKKKKKKRQE